MKLTPAQQNVLLTGRLPLQERTLDILAENGFIAPGWPMQILPRGEAFVETRMNRQRENLAERSTGTPFITTDQELFDLLQEDPKNEIYVYRGSLPMVVRDGDGQSPLALLDPVYRWKIEAIRSHGKFLEKVHLMGWKSSYGYRLKEAYRRRMTVPIDGKLVEMD